MNADELARRLDEDRTRLEGFVTRRAGVCLRHETVEDLVQSVHLAAIGQAESFEYRSRPEFEAWVLRLAKGHLADRRDYWTAAKRRPERLLRLTRADGGTDPAAVSEPARPTPGPSTRADRADLVGLAEEALTLLLPRDVELVRGEADGHDLADEAERLGLSPAATQRARGRARERYRKAFELIRKKRGR